MRVDREESLAFRIDFSRTTPSGVVFLWKIKCNILNLIFAGRMYGRAHHGNRYIRWRLRRISRKMRMNCRANKELHFYHAGARYVASWLFILFVIYYTQGSEPHLMMSCRLCSDPQRRELFSCAEVFIYLGFLFFCFHMPQNSCQIVASYCL